MAENPATWGIAERVVSDAIDRAEAQRALGYCGLSMIRVITDALREAGLLREEPEADAPPDRRLPTPEPPPFGGSQSRWLL